MGRLDDKVVLITGGARGQGAAEARQAAAEGAAVVVTDVLDELGQKVAAEVSGDYHHLDVASGDQWRAVVDSVVADRGTIDGLVNNAGIFDYQDVLSMGEDDYRRVIDVNQHGVYLGMATVAPVMVEQKSGSIVNISSVAGMKGHAGIAYTASKWAVRGMTKSAAVALAEHNVRVNSVHPGTIETEMLLGSASEEHVERVISAIPMRRSAKSEEVGSVVMFLLSDGAGYMTGAELVVDGGMILP